jgi:hypothetical protein
VLLPSDTYIKLITSVTAVLLPFVTYLLILLHTIVDVEWEIILKGLIVAFSKVNLIYMRYPGKDEVISL